MDIKGKYESRVQKIGLSCDAFSTGCLVMCLLFFVPYVANTGGTLVIWFLPLACLVPFAVMPIVYMYIHRFDTLLFGRYHFVMPLSAFIAAPFFVMAWSASGNAGEQSCLIFFGLLIFTVAVMIYRYCAFSVRARLGGIGIVDKSVAYEIITVLGCVASAAAFCGFLYYDPQTAYLNTAYVMGGVIVLLAIAQYLITFYGIPRLGGRRVESIKSVFASFYGGLNVKMYLSALLFESAFAVIAALVVYFAFSLGVGVYGAVAVAATVIGVNGITAFVCSRVITRRSMRLSVIDISCVVLSSAVLTVLAAVRDSSNGALAGLIIAAAIAGVGSAVAVRQSKLRLLTVKPRITNGTAFILFEFTMFAATGIALFVAAIVTAVLSTTHSVTAFIYGFGSAVLIAGIAFFLCSRPSSKRSGSDDAKIVITSDRTDDAIHNTDTQNNSETQKETP